jgi:hypothetical protein
LNSMKATATPSKVSLCFATDRHWYKGAKYSFYSNVIKLANHEY